MPSREGKRGEARDGLEFHPCKAMLGSVLSPNVVRFVQGNFAWYFALFGYSTNAV